MLSEDKKDRNGAPAGCSRDDICMPSRIALRSLTSTARKR